MGSFISTTPLKSNLSPENQWLEDVFPTKIVPFWGHVSFQGCTPLKINMEHTHGGLVQIIFLSEPVICRF